MSIKKFARRIRVVAKRRRRQSWRAQLVDLNYRIAQLERVMRESRPTRIRPSHAECFTRINRDLELLKKQRERIKKHLPGLLAS